MFEKRYDLWALPEWLDNFLALGYDGIMQGLKQKDIQKNSERNLKHTGKAIPTGLVMCYRRDKFLLRDQDHGSGSGTILFLTSRIDPTKTFAVASTHLNGDPSQPEKQIEQLNGIQKKLAKHKTLYTLVVGDFNDTCEVGSPVLGWATGLGMRKVDMDGGVTYAGRQSQEPYHGCHVDQIMYSSNLQLLARLETKLT